MIPFFQSTNTLCTLSLFCSTICSLSITNTMKNVAFSGSRCLFRRSLIPLAAIVTLWGGLAACSTVQSIRSAALTSGNERTFNREMSVVLPAVRQALLEERMTIAQDSLVDENTHILIGETPARGFSWGELVRIVALKRGGDKTTLRVLTQRKMATTLLAKGDYSMDIFFSVEQKIAE
jgi:hypothetical protein